MKITLDITVIIDGNRTTKGSDFTVRKADDIAKLAYDWIVFTKKDTGYRTTIIEKVMLNNEHDITDLVKKLDEAPLPPDDLPF